MYVCLLHVVTQHTQTHTQQQHNIYVLLPVKLDKIPIFRQIVQESWRNIVQRLDVAIYSNFSHSSNWKTTRMNENVNEKQKNWVRLQFIVGISSFPLPHGARTSSIYSARREATSTTTTKTHLKRMHISIWCCCCIDNHMRHHIKSFWFSPISSGPIIRLSARCTKTAAFRKAEPKINIQLWTKINSRFRIVNGCHRDRDEKCVVSDVRCRFSIGASRPGMVFAFTTQKTSTY